MGVDLFSLVLEGAATWGIGRLLDTLISCGICGDTYERGVPNQQTSNLVCSRCQGWLDQYTNATDHTVNSNGSIAAGYVSNLHWSSWGGFWGSPFNPHFELNCVNSKYEDLVVRIELSEFQGYTFYRDEMILRPSYDRNHWGDIYWKVPRERFPDQGGTFACDIYLFNTWGDELHRRRLLGNQPGGSE